MINKEEKEIIKTYRKMKKYGAENLALVDRDIFDIEAVERFKLEDRIKEIEKERDYYKKLYNESNDWLFDYEEFKESKHIPRID